MSDLNIAMVWPKGFEFDQVMPLPLGYLKSNIDNERYDAKIFDCVLRDEDSKSVQLRSDLKEFNPDIVCVSCYSHTYEEALRILRLAKSINPRITTVIGGVHVTAYPDKTMENDTVDFLFRGEAELSFSVFLEELCKEKPDWSRVKGLTYREDSEGYVQNDMDGENCLDKIKIPDYEAIDLDAYISKGYRLNSPKDKRNAPVWFTRGCPYRCQYCSAPMLNGKKVRVHTVEYMVEWVKYLYYRKNIRWISILDDNFTFHVKYAKEFCRAMIDLDLKDLCFGTPNGIRMERGDSELWSLMRQAGWRSVVIAPESGSEHTLGLMKKDLDLEALPRIVKDIRSSGLKVHAFFIVGYPGETLDDINQTAEIIRKIKFNWVGIHAFQPLPGTPIFDDLVKASELSDKFLPRNVLNGKIVYKAKELRDFNLAKFSLKVYSRMMLADPSNIPYILTCFGLRFLSRKFLVHVKEAVFLSKNQAEKTCL